MTLRCVGCGNTSSCHENFPFVFCPFCASSFRTRSGVNVVEIAQQTRAARSYRYKISLISVLLFFLLFIADFVAYLRYVKVHSEESLNPVALLASTIPMAALIVWVLYWPDRKTKKEFPLADLS